MKDRNVSLPSPCECGVSYFEDHSRFVHNNNCEFYGNNAACVAAFEQMIASLKL